MKPWFLAAAMLAVPAADAAAAPVSLFSGTLTADALAAAPLGATPSLASLNDRLGGGVVTGDVLVASPGTGTLTIALQDLGAVGDIYEVILDGLSLGLTSQVAVGGPAGSTGAFSAPVVAGTYDIGVSDFVLTYLGSTPPFGGTDPSPLSQSDFLLAVDFDAAPAAVPEAPTLALLGTALGTLGLGLRRRASARA